MTQPSRTSRLGIRLLTALLGLQLAGCVYVPRTTEVFDAECQIHARQMTLKPEVLPGFLNCTNQACSGMLVAAGLVTAASVVVSGSIVVAGNMVYWFEKQGRCER